MGAAHDDDATGIFDQDIDFAATYVIDEEPDLVADHIRDEAMIPDPSSSSGRGVRLQSGAFERSSNPFAELEPANDSDPTNVFDRSMLEEEDLAGDGAATCVMDIAPGIGDLFDDDGDLDQTRVVVRDEDDFAATHRLVDDEDELPTSVAFPKDQPDKVSTAIADALSNPPLSPYAGLKRQAPQNLSARQVDVPLTRALQAENKRQQSLVIALVCVIVALLAVLAAIAVVLLV